MYKADFPRIFNYKYDGEDRSMLCWEKHNISIDFECKFEGSLRDFLINKDHNLTNEQVEELLKQYEIFDQYFNEFSIDQIKHKVLYNVVNGIPESLRKYFDDVYNINLHEGWIGENLNQLIFSQSNCYDIISINHCPTVSINYDGIQIIDGIQWNTFIDSVVNGIKHNMIDKIKSDTTTRRYHQYTECSIRGSGTHSFVYGEFVEASCGDFIKLF